MKNEIYKYLEKEHVKPFHGSYSKDGKQIDVLVWSKDLDDAKKQINKISHEIKVVKEISIKEAKEFDQKQAKEMKKLNDDFKNEMKTQLKSFNSLFENFSSSFSLLDDFNKEIKTFFNDHEFNFNKRLLSWFDEDDKSLLEDNKKEKKDKKN